MDKSIPASSLLTLLLSMRGAVEAANKRAFTDLRQALYADEGSIKEILGDEYWFAAERCSNALAALLGLLPGVSAEDARRELDTELAQCVRLLNAHIH